MRRKSTIFLLSLLLIFKVSTAQWKITPGPSMTSPLCLSSVDSLLFVATSSGVYKSSDDGLTWEFLEVGAVTNSFSCILTFNSIIYIGTNGSAATNDDGLFKSIDYGNTWTKCKNGKIYQLFSSGNKLFVTSTGGFFSSQDNGLTWQQEFSSISIQYLTANTNKLFGCDPFTGIYSRQASDTAWNSLSIAGITDLDFESIAVKDSILCVATTGDFFISHNLGGSWTHPSNSGIVNLPITSLFLDNNFIYGATNSYLIRSQDGGNTWDTINYTAPQAIAKYQNKLLLGNQNGLYLSTDYGTTWTTLYSVNLLTAIRSLATKDSIILAGISNTLYYSSDDGNHWDKTVLNGGNINCILPVDSLVLVGTLTGTGIFKRNWNDTSWTSINNGLTNLSIRSLARNGNIIYAGTSNGLFSSTNLGQNWTDISSTLPYRYIYSILIDSSRIFVGTSNGVYFTQNNGTSWALAPISIPAGTVVQTLAMKDSIILAGTFGYGVFISTDHGLSWSPSNSGFTGTNYFVRFITVIGSNIYSSLTSQSTPTIGLLFLSADNGANWTYSPPVINGVIYSKINAIANNGHHLFAVSNTNFLLKKPVAQLLNSCAYTVAAKSYVCEYDSVLLSANNGPGFTYQWLRQGIPISGATSPTYYAKQSGQYSCTFGGGCVGTSPSFTLYGRFAPQPTISPSYHIICPQNDSALFSVDNPLSSYTYQWKHSSGIIPGATNLNYYAKVLGNYYCIVTDSFQCKGISNPTLLDYNPYADSIITITGSPAICMGDSIELQANNGVGNSHQWMLNGVNLPSDTLYFCYAKIEGVYNCLLTFGCKTLSIPITISYTPNSYFIPHLDTLIPNVWHIENLCSGNSSLTYVWDWGDFTSSAGDSPAHLYSTTSKYNVCVTATDSSGCSNSYCDSIYASAIYITPSLATNSSTTISSINKVEIYPIPFSNELTIDLNSNDFTQIKIYNLFGNVIYQNKLKNKLTINSVSFSKGIYIVELTDGKTLFHRKVYKY